MQKSKNAVLLVAVIFIISLIPGCSSNAPVEPYECPLTGTWSESYRLQYLGGIQPENGICKISDSISHTEGQLFISTILFNSGNFELRIRDSLNAVCKEVNGVYEYTGDLVVLNAEHSWHRYYEERSIPYDPYAEYVDTLMIARLDVDTLVLNTMIHFDEETGITEIKINSFIWTVSRLPMYFNMKTSGMFIREE